MGKLWKNYSLAIVLTVLFLGSWALQGWTGWEEFEAEQMEHSQAASFWGQGGYIWDFAQSTFENWQSEFLQLLTFVILTAYLLFKGSPESKDSDEETKEMLRDIQDRLRQMETDRGTLD